MGPGIYFPALARRSFFNSSSSGIVGAAVGGVGAVLPRLSGLGVANALALGGKLLAVGPVVVVLKPGDALAGNVAVPAGEVDEEPPASRFERLQRMLLERIGDTV